MFTAAIAAHCLARAGALALMLTTSLARHEGLGSDYVKSLRRSPAIISLLVSLFFVIFLIGVWSIAVIAATIAGAMTIRWWSIKKIGGITGDVLGAAEQVSEALILIALSAR
jgi:adenosylcobinamide-GDP ribazoletransferase